MNYIKQIPQETKIRFFSEFIIKLVSFLIIPIITYGVGLNEYSYFIIITCVINGLLPLFLLGFNFSIIKKLATNQNLKNNSIKVFSSISLISIFSLLIFFFSFLISYIFFKNLLVINLIVILISFFTAILQLLFEFLRSKNKSNIFSIFQIFEAFLLIFLSSLIFLINELNLVRLLLLILFIKTLCSSLIFLYLIKLNLLSRKYLTFDQKIIKNYISPGLIFIALGMSEWLINFSDKLILDNFLSPLYLSIYFTAAMFSGILNSLGSIFWWDLFPKLLILKKKNNYAKIFSLIRNKNSLFVDFSILFVLILIIILPIIQKLLLNSNFVINHYIYLIFFISVFTHQISTGWEFFCYINNKEKFILINSIIWGFISFVLYLLLIPNFKIDGALFSLLCVKIGYSLSLRYYCKKNGFKENILEKKEFLKFIYFFSSFLIFTIILKLDLINLGFIITDLTYVLLILILYYLFLNLGKKLFNIS